VEVRVHAPQLRGQSWICDFEIIWPAATELGHGMGADSVQALRLALQNIAALLYMSRYHKEQQLIWETAGSGYGFPLHPNSRDLAIGDDRFL
jgi:hypothetical protein